MLQCVMICWNLLKFAAINAVWKLGENVWKLNYCSLKWSYVKI